jgi:CDP-6-deoxy-D-xylo-4-hexulose-3-dehydrase
MDRLEEFVGDRRRNFAFLKERLNSCTDFLMLPEETLNSEASWFGFPITIKPESGIERNDLIRFLEESRIATRLLFAGNLIRQPYMINREYRVVGDLDNTDVTMSHTFWIGVYPGLTSEMLEYIAVTIETFLGVNF